MDADRQKRTSRHVRLLGRVLLLVVVGIGVVGYVSYRKTMGPPPTPPGKSPEFDKHLAEMDKNWIFLFSRDDSIVVTDIYGHTKRALTYAHYGEKTLFSLRAGVLAYSPSGTWAVVWVGSRGRA